MKQTIPLISLLLLATLAANHPVAAAAPTKPLKVFILAGQSNMEGQAVVDLEGKDYHQGAGTLATLLRDPVIRSAPCRNTKRTS